MAELVEHSDYLVFVDESGDHHLTRIDPQFPVFVLLFAILRKDDYVEKSARPSLVLNSSSGGTTRWCCTSTTSANPPATFCSYSRNH